MAQCLAITTKKTQCSFKARDGSKFCGRHQDYEGKLASVSTPQKEKTTPAKKVVAKKAAVKPSPKVAAAKKITPSKVAKPVVPLPLPSDEAPVITEKKSPPKVKTPPKVAEKKSPLIAERKSPRVSPRDERKEAIVSVEPERKTVSRVPFLAAGPAKREPEIPKPRKPFSPRSALAEAKVQYPFDYGLPKLELVEI